MNGEDACAHTGGYLPFSADITQLLYAEWEENSLVVRVTDDTDKSSRTRGKQKLKPGGIWYTPVERHLADRLVRERAGKLYHAASSSRRTAEKSSVELFVDGEGPCRALIGGMAYDFYAGTPALLRAGGAREALVPGGPAALRPLPRAGRGPGGELLRHAQLLRRGGLRGR